MIVSADVLRAHLDYTAWASQRIVDAAAQLSEEELTRDFQTADHSVLGTLVHIFAGDRIWLSRVRGNPRSGFIGPEDMHLPVLQNEWAVVNRQWIEHLAGLADDDAHAHIAYTDLKGNRWESPLWQIVLHVVNHGSHHRGQASGMIRAMGHKPPPLDLIAYYRQKQVP
jgi:uncharacterized damage-inducible protein DinB